MPHYHENFVRLLYTIILGQFIVIAVLLGGLSNEYLSNAYMRTWISANLPLLGILLHGEVDALFIGVALGAMVLLIQRRVGAGRAQEDPRRGVKPAAPGNTSTSSVRNRTLQSNPIPDHPSSSGAKPHEEPPQDSRNELKKTDS